MSGVLCGATRPTFFRGVATVVNILFNMVTPDVALFGEKDYQQLQIIRRMAGDLQLPVEIEAVQTVRDADGLALSSRNLYLTAQERQQAPAMYRALCAARDALRDGNRDFTALQTSGERAMAENGFKPDYFSIRRAADLGEPAAGDDDLVVLAAGWLGNARLIDNVKT